MTKEEKNAIVDDFTDDDEVKSELNLWNYKDDKEIIGVVLRKEEGQYGEQVVLSAGEDNEVTLPSLTALNTKLANVEIGAKVKIVYLGEVRSEKTGRMYSDFKVFTKKA